jgi:hypothetical protein
MYKDRDYYYTILGLKAGASPDEIKSAYRRLVKLYHPDRCQSADSLPMYDEVRAAYKKLTDWHLHRDKPTGFKVHHTYQTHQTHHAPHARHHSSRTGTNPFDSRYSSQTKQTYGHNQESTKSTTRTSGNNQNFFWKTMWTFGKNRSYSKEVTWGPSVKNPANGCFCLFVSFLAVFVSILLTLGHNKPPAWFLLVSWILLYVFLNIYSHSKWPFYMKIIAGLAYGELQVFLIYIILSIPVSNLFLTGLFSVISAWVLLADS